MLAVEGGAGMGRYLEAVLHFSVHRIEGVHLVAAGEPDLSAVIGDTPDIGDAFEGTIFLNDLGFGFAHGSGSRKRRKRFSVRNRDKTKKQSSRLRVARGVTRPSR